MPKTLALLQARMSSTRLPGKVLLPLLGEPMLFRQIERLKRCQEIDQLMIVTSTDPSDDALVSACKTHGISFFRGSLDDVLDRYYQAALSLSPTLVVRLTGDCPLIDPTLVDDLIRFHKNGNYEYSSNSLEPSLPDGLDAEVMNFACLKTAWEKAQLKSEREHVTPYLYKNYKTEPLFKVGILRHTPDLSKLRWTVDEPQDFELVTKIYEELYPKNPSFLTDDVLQFLNSRPEFNLLNSDITRNEGYLKSLKLEKK